MAEIGALRAKLQDRLVKDGALGSIESTICLDLTLTDALDDAKADLIEAQRVRDSDIPIVRGQKRLGDGPLPEPAEPKDDLDVTAAEKAVTTAEKAVQDNSLTLKFRAIGSSKYQDVQNPFAGLLNTSEGFANFLNALCEECLTDVVDGDGDHHKDITWEELRDQASRGEWDEITDRVFALNQRRVDVPFSPKPSKKTRR